MTNSRSKLNYDPTKLKRELDPFYISMKDSEISTVLNGLGLKNLDDLYNHIGSDVKFSTPPFVTERLEYDALIDHMEAIALKNKIMPSFIGDGLQNYKVPSIVPYVCSLRGLVTAYTPYQPERSQGTLNTLWAYSSTISMLTGFEAINASLYDRSTCLFEALNTATRLVKNANTVFVASNIYPGDLEVLKTHARETKLNIKTIPFNKATSRLDTEAIKKMVESLKSDEVLGGIAFPQVNNFGVLEDVNALTDLCNDLKVSSIGIIDPMLLATKGLLRPSHWGSSKQGVQMIVGEGQHLAIGPNFGGPGLGIFGIRFNDTCKNDIRQTAGRFVGLTNDDSGNRALCMVLSTREQHIRREKATSNICSNQSFISTLAGAAILERGELGMTQAMLKGFEFAQLAYKGLSQLNGVKLAFNQAVFNEFTLEVNQSAKNVLGLLHKQGIQAGVDISDRVNDGRQLILVSFSDVHSTELVEKLVNAFSTVFEKTNSKNELPKIDATLLSSDTVGLPQYPIQELKTWYKNLSDQNLSPDDFIYPLGSCTMKYNPYINEWAAGLQGFTDIHPQAPIEDVQGSLEILFEIQEFFKNITGLAAVTTQPVAGAQGELVGLKMFQGYHRKNGEAETRNIILIPKSAHGTNPATATMAGYETKNIAGVEYGIVTINADTNGLMDLVHVTTLIQKYNNRIAGIMVTNPNTSGLFETNFKKIADLVHGVGGLVYMDGANMNAIAGWVDLNKMGVDAVHNNLHKTWTIPHGGGGPGDGIVAVSSRLVEFLPGIQVKKENGFYTPFTTKDSIGSIHRHVGNFAHKVRAYTYIKALGTEGVRKMSAVAVLSSRYLFDRLCKTYPTLPETHEPRMHEFILTISKDTFDRIEKAGTPKANAIARVGKLFLDFGLHAPTVAFPEQFGLMIEPTETFSKAELDRFIEIVESIYTMINEHPEVLLTAPHFACVHKVNEVEANKTLVLSERLTKLHKVPSSHVQLHELMDKKVKDIYIDILKAAASK